ncbi:hypothetical protein BgiMline_020145 [Biomphalaria glabrata]|nr:hypothetical protein BgiMline_029843 [Biomphalaria glabrata]
MFTGFVHSYILGYNVMTLTASQYQTPVACATACTSMTNFTCLSFELDYTLIRCNLQDITWFLADPSDLFSALSITSDYYQRHCEYVPE